MKFTPMHNIKLLLCFVADCIAHPNPSFLNNDQPLYSFTCSARELQRTEINEGLS